MVKIFGIRFGEQKQDDRPEVCRHPFMKQGMRLNPDKNEMEMYCKQCGQKIEEAK